MPNITTSVPLEWYNKAKERNLKWNECLIRGIKEICEEPFKESQGETIIQESWKAKAIKIQNTMQKTIDELNQQLKK